MGRRPLRSAPVPVCCGHPLRGRDAAPQHHGPTLAALPLYSLLLGLAQALFTVNIPTTVAAWFKKKLGVAVGIQQSIGGMGASVTAPALALLVALTGWQVGFWIIAAVGGVILFSLLFFFHSEPADRGMKPLGADDDEPAPVPVNSATARLRSKVFMQHARRTRAFWNLPFIHFLGCMGHAIVIWHVVFFATEQGLSLTAAAWTVTIYTLASVSSRLFIPILADRWGAKATMILPYFLQGVTVIMLFWAQSAWEFYFFAVLFGIGFGGEMSAFLIANRSTMAWVRCGQFLDSSTSARVSAWPPEDSSAA